MPRPRKIRCRQTSRHCDQQRAPRKALEVRWSDRWSNKLLNRCSTSADRPVAVDATPKKTIDDAEDEDLIQLGPKDHASNSSSSFGLEASSLESSAQGLNHAQSMPVPSTDRRQSDHYDFEHLSQPVEQCEAQRQSQQALVEAELISDSVSEKKMARYSKKAAREAVKEAWIDREDARVRVCGSFSVEAAEMLRETTCVYHKRREELQALMGNGKLNEEDAASFPRFSDMDISAPKARPEGIVKIKRRRKEKPHVRETRSTENSPSNAAHILASSQHPLPYSAEACEAIDRVRAAKTLRQQAKDYFKQAHPHSEPSYGTWKANGAAKLGRANVLYNKKLKVLKEVFHNDGVPSELQTEFPDV